MTDWIDRLLEQRAREHESRLDEPFGESAPLLHPGATADEIDQLERSMGVPIEPFYRYFLSRADGMENFYLGMTMLGCRDWRERSPRLVAAEQVRGDVLSVLNMDVGLPEDATLAPIAIVDDWSDAIFCFYLEGIPERYWWVGGGDSFFYPDLRHIFDFSTRVMGYLREYSPRASLNE